jgi:sialate O-acetylesterase
VKIWLSLLSGYLVVSAGTAPASIRLPQLLADNMVLQRDAPIALWGWADAGERVAVEFRGSRASTKADGSGRWQVTLPPQRAGGPYEMTLRGSDVVTLRNILIGDVWLASGQSNMQFPLVSQNGFGGVNNAEAEIRTANFPNMRLFQVKRAQARRPRGDVDRAGWVAATPDTVATFSAVAYLFGRELQQRYGIPIGLIDATWGGTPAETWMSSGSLRGFPEFAPSLTREAGLPDTAEAQYEAYVIERNRWYRLHGSEDRGRLDGHAIWAAADFDDSGWPIVTEPQPWPRKAVKDFDGTLWLRKSVDIPPERAGRPLRVHLCAVLQADTTFFNGHLIGETRGERPPRNYEVPGTFVNGGRNVLAVRLTGAYTSGDGFVGMHGEADDLYADFGGESISLAGTWRYQPGPDLADLPDPVPVAEFLTPFPQSPTLLFNGMIAPLTRYRLKGVVWYQGESNVARAAQYRTLFPALIRDWRTAWGYDMPFLFVQLAGFGRDKANPADTPLAELRDAQSAALMLPDTAMATAIDIGDEADIHPKNKQDVAHRLAQAAARTAYHEAVIASGPTFVSLRTEGNDIRVRFANVGSRLKTPEGGAAVRGFAIAGSDRRFLWAVAHIDGPDVIVHNDAIRKPVVVRYDWGNTPNGNLYNEEGLPAVPFRTDRAGSVAP